jgi:hypothetical protein
MKASEIKYQVGDTVCITHDWGEKELGIILEIPDGGEIDEVTIGFNDGDSGVYRPEDAEKVEGI